MPDNLHEEVGRWVIKAEHDLRTARSVLKDTDPITDTGSFHCQQCIEKCFKAVLVSRLKHIHKSHYLPFLLEECLEVESGLSIFMETAERLYRYAITSRYPDDWREISLEEAQEALRRAEEVYAFVTDLLNERGYELQTQPTFPRGMLAESEKETVRLALEQANGNIALAARRLGIARGTLYKKMEEHGLK